MTKHTFLVPTFLCLALALTSGCGKSDRDVAVVGGEPVSKADFEAYLAFKRISPDQKERLERALDEYTERAALTAAIEQEHKLDEARIKAELEEQRKEMVISRYFEELLRERVSDSAVRNFYDSHAQDYEERKLRVAHVLVRLSPSMDEAEQKARLVRAQEAFAKLRTGEDFAQVAATYSEDRISAPKGGDLGWIKQGGIDPKFSEVAFKLPAGQVSEPFQSQFGYHVIKVLEGPATVKRPFESVAGDIRYRLRQEAKQAELTRLKSKVKVEKNPAVLATIKPRPADKGDKPAQKQAQK